MSVLIAEMNWKLCVVIVVVVVVVILRLLVGFCLDEGGSEMTVAKQICI